MAEPNYTDGERLVKLETKMDTVLNNQETQTSKFDELNKKLIELLPTYATKEDLEGLKRKSSLQVWITGSLSAILGSIMTFLVMFFVTTISK